MDGKEKKQHSWIKKYLSGEDIIHISRMVTQAEAHTSGEIVPIICKRSSAIGHVPVVTFLLLAIALLTADLSWHPSLSMEALLGILVGCLVASWFISLQLARWSFWQRIMTSNLDEQQQVWIRAELEFSRNKVSQTQQKTGILIFVSVMERRAVVLADEGISKHYPPETWKELVAELSSHLKNDQWTLGFEKAIQKASKILSEKLPAERHELNELANHLRILE